MSLYVILGEKIAVKRRKACYKLDYLLLKKAPFENDLVHSGYQFVLHRRHQEYKA